MPGRVVRGMVVEVKVDPQGRKKRHCLVIQNDIGNKNSTFVIVAPITSADDVPRASAIGVRVPRGESGLDHDSYVLCHQIRTVNENRLGEISGQLTAKTMKEVDDALRISLAL